MDGLVKLKDLQNAWKVYNDLPTPKLGSPAYVFKNRAHAWDQYTRVRDLYLYQVGALTLPQITRPIRSEMDH